MSAYFRVALYCSPSEKIDCKEFAQRRKIHFYEKRGCSCYHYNMKFSIKDGRDFGWDGLKAKAINSKDDFANASAAYFEVTGSHGKVKTEISDRIYLVLDGEGEFTIDGQPTLVHKDDVVIVPKNTPYDYRAVNDTVLKLYLVHTPAYDPEFERKLG